jgi:predicted secreted protein
MRPDETSLAQFLRTSFLSGLFLGSVLGTQPVAAQTVILPQTTYLQHGTALHLSQRAEQLVPRDLGQVDLRIEIAGNDPKQLQSEVTKQLDAALARAKKFKDVSVETGVYTVVRQVLAVNPRTLQSVMGAPNGTNMSMVVQNNAGWRATQLVSIVSHDFSAIASLASDLQTDGMQLTEMKFSVRPETMKAIQTELASQALVALRAQAAKLASDLGMRVERIANIDVANSPPENPPLQRPFLNPAQRNFATIVPSGEATVWVMVSANVLLTQKEGP